MNNINSKERKEIEETTEKALNKRVKTNIPSLYQTGKINIANLGSGNINFNGMTLDQVSEKFGKLIPVLNEDNFKIYKAENLDGIHFVFNDDEYCVGSLLNDSQVEKLKQMLSEKDIIIREQRKQNKLLKQRVSDLKDEVKYLRSKIDNQTT